MRMESIDGLPVKSKINIQCDDCGAIWKQLISGNKVSRKRRGNNIDTCASCSAIRSVGKKPQCSKEYWDGERKYKHGESIKLSETYRTGIKSRPSTVGKNNPMYGKVHSVETKLKMSVSRTGKTGELATAWKGGKLSINQRVKSALQRKYRWFHNIMDRDGGTCQHCGVTSNLDAHHIKPISAIIKELLETVELITESDKMNWLIIQSEIIDKDLTNGITLCRICHKNEHLNWGSHNAKIK